MKGFPFIGSVKGKLSEDYGNSFRVTRSRARARLGNQIIQID